MDDNILDLREEREEYLALMIFLWGKQVEVASNIVSLVSSGAHSGTS